MQGTPQLFIIVPVILNFASIPVAKALDTATNQNKENRQVLVLHLCNCMKYIMPCFAIVLLGSSLVQYSGMIFPSCVVPCVHLTRPVLHLLIQALINAHYRATEHSHLDSFTAPGHSLP
jgi:hypothetical protein